MDAYGMTKSGELVEWLTCGTWKEGTRFVPEVVAEPIGRGQQLRYIGTELDAARHKLMDSFVRTGHRSRVVSVSESAARCNFLGESNQVNVGHVEIDEIVYPCSSEYGGLHLRISVQSGEGPIKMDVSVGSFYKYSGNVVAQRLSNALDAEFPDWRENTEHWFNLNKKLDELLKSKKNAAAVLARMKRNGNLKPIEEMRGGSRRDTLMFYRTSAVKTRFFPMEEWSKGVDPSGWGEEGLDMDTLKSREANPHGPDTKVSGVVIWRIRTTGRCPVNQEWNYKRV